MRKFHLLTITFLFAAIAQAQLSGVKTIPGNYATIAAAVTDLNSQGVGGGGVTFNIATGHTETSADSIYLTATGTAANPIIIQKSGAGANPKITRTGTGLLATTAFGGNGDAVFIIESSDFVTIDAIDIATTDAGIEYGYYLRKVSGTNGCKNDNIKNCVITLTKGTSQFVIGIYSSNNFKGQSTASSDGVTVTNVSGRNENIAMTGNTISNVFSGIYVRSFMATAPYDFYDQNFTIGSAGAGNTIQNFASDKITSTVSAFGIYLEYGNGAKVTYNTINNTANGGTTATNFIYGIYQNGGTNSSVTIDNNNIALTSTGRQVFGITNQATGNLVLNNNTIALNVSATLSVSCSYISNSSAASIEINNNTFVGTTINIGTSGGTTGTCHLISNPHSSAGLVNISGNAISGTLNKTGGGILIGCNSGNSSSSGGPRGTDNIFNNNFSNITLAGSGIFTGISSETSLSGTANIYNNIISNITGTNAGTITAINAGNGNRNTYGNNIFAISTSGNSTSTGSLTGIITTSSSSNNNCYKNKIYNLSTSGFRSVISGISVNSGSAKIYNNLIGDLRTAATVATNVDAVTGINLSSISSPGSFNVYYNTIYLNNVTSVQNFTIGILHGASATATTSTLDLRNNIIVNTSTPNGGQAIAFKRTGVALDNYAATSNNNLFYAGTPGANNLIYSDGTNSDQTLAQYKARVSPRDANSVTENPPFLSTTGSSSDFLHINPAVGSQAKSGGTPISGYTDDYDGDLRDASKPDIGADEFQAVLPVTLIDLRGERKGTTNNISWSTLTEINNTGFEVQRGVNGQSFSSIGFVTSKANNGNSIGALQYSFNDMAPNSGNNFYRLKQVDKDGRSSYSNVVVLKGVTVTMLTLNSIYPNPATDKINVMIAAAANEKINIVITDVAGKVVMQKISTVLTGDNIITFNVNQLASGSYFIKAICASGCNKAILKFGKH